MAALTLNQARTSLENLLKDISDVSQQNFIEWGNFANRQIYNFIVGIDPERFINSTSTYTVTTSPTTSALPATFMSIQPMGCGFFEIDQNGVDTDIALPVTNYGSALKGYYIKGTNVIFTGINSSTQFRLRHIPTLTTLTLMTETIILDEIYLEAFRDDLARYYQLWDEATGAESLADFRFARTLNELADTIKKGPDAWALDDFSSSF